MATPAKIVDLDLPIVALVGRVNVGKSTLFNRIVGGSKALVSKIAGTTRTRNISPAFWRGKNFLLVDTGGLTFSDEVKLESDIVEQTEKALKQADLIVFVSDVQEGLLPQEKELVKLITAKYKEKPLIFVANKADNPSLRGNIYEPEWMKMRLGLPLLVSAQNGSGVGDLLDAIYTRLNKLGKRPKVIKEVKPIKVAIIGKPNVGKSSLFNKLIGEERVIVNPMAHTTREPHDTLVEIDGQHMLFVDTAGIRRKTKVSGELERIGIGKSIEAVTRADIVLFVVDAAEPVSDQDQQLAGLLREHTKSVIIVVNKWDLAEDNDDIFRNEVKKKLYSYFPHLAFAPIVLVSAKTEYRIHQIYPLIIRAWNERHIEIPDEVLKNFIKSAVKAKLPSRGKGVHHPSILGLRQLASNPPIFEMLIKAKTSVHFSYVHYIANRLREQFSFFATPVVIKLTKMKQGKIE